MDDDCFACALTAGRLPLPGGLLHGTALWRVEHCVGPLGLGTLVVKPVRHVTAVAALTEAEPVALGPLLRTASAVATRLAAGEGEGGDEGAGADQVYNCLWSHAGGRPVHVHYVVQPVTRTQMAQYGTQGPALQAAMFASGPPLDPDAVEAVADRARALFADPPP